MKEIPEFVVVITYVLLTTTICLSPSVRGEPEPAILHTDIHQEQEIGGYGGYGRYPQQTMMARPMMSQPMMEETFDSKPVVVKVSPPVMVATKPTMKPLRTRVVVVHNNMVPVPIECFQPPDSGSCGKDMVRVYYDHETRTCKPFSYTGCGGNANRFLSVKNCYRICHPYRYQVKPVVANVKKPVMLSAPRQIAIARPVVQRQVRQEIIAQPRPQMIQMQAPRPQMAMIPVSSYQSVPVVQSVPIMRSGYMAVPANNYGGYTQGGYGGYGGNRGYGGYGGFGGR